MRWCGDIVLTDTLILAKKQTIRLEQGLTPTRPQNPVDFEGNQIFADTAIMSLQAGSQALLQEEATIRIREGATLVLDSGSVVILKRDASIKIESGSALLLKPTAKMTLSNGAKIVIENGGKLLYRGGEVLLSGDDTEIKVENGGLLKTTNQGQVIINGEGHLIQHRNGVIDIGPSSRFSLEKSGGIFGKKRFELGE